ncbi:Helix-turn-helix domain protein [compost metagenome]
MLAEMDYPAAEIARKLSYDSSNFTKFYKKHAGMTPGQYRQRIASPVKYSEEFTTFISGNSGGAKVFGQLAG